MLIGDIKRIDHKVNISDWQVWLQYFSAGDFAKFVNLNITGKEPDVPDKEDIEINWPERTEYGETENQILKDIF